MDLRAQAALLMRQQLDMVLLRLLITTILDDTHAAKDGDMLVLKGKDVLKFYAPWL